MKSTAQGGMSEHHAVQWTEGYRQSDGTLCGGLEDENIIQTMQTGK